MNFMQNSDIYSLTRDQMPSDTDDRKSPSKKCPGAFSVSFPINPGKALLSVFPRFPESDDR